MSYRVVLTESDQAVMLQALICSLEIKQDLVIRDPARLRATQAQYESAGAKFMLPIVIHRSHNNLMTWMADQIQHTPGMSDTDLGDQALQICESVIRNTY